MAYHFISSVCHFWISLLQPCPINHLSSLPFFLMCCSLLSFVYDSELLFAVLQGETQLTAALTGPGIVFIQSLPFHRLSQRISRQESHSLSIISLFISEELHHGHSQAWKRRVGVKLVITNLKKNFFPSVMNFGTQNFMKSAPTTLERSYELWWWRYLWLKNNAVRFTRDFELVINDPTCTNIDQFKQP